jgi:hypothetical protein
MTPGAELVGYKQIRVTDELCRSVQRANGMPLRQHQTLGELVSIMTAQRGICGPEDLISEERTRHEVRVDGRVLYTFYFVDAHMLPFLLRGAPVEVWDLGSRRGFGRRDLPLQRFASHEQREELP